MLLRRKFGLLALIYVLSLSANLVMSAWCIVVYFRSAFVGFEAEFAREQQIEQLRHLVRRQAAEIGQAASTSRDAGNREETQRAVSAMMARLDADMAASAIGAAWVEIRAAEARKVATVGRGLSARPAGAATAPAVDEIRAAFEALEHSLSQAAAGFARQRQESVAHAASVQEQVMTILMVNAACGAALCGLGLVFVRRWVIRPVAALREATRQIAGGNFAYRLVPESRDELGRLADEVNRMSATIVTMQQRMIERERLAAAGEMATRVAHNIRNPLAGIRALAEATSQRAVADSETVECQQRIIETVDRFEKWLRDLQQSVAPLALQPEPVPIAPFIENVARALRPMLDRRRVRVDVAVDAAVRQVRIDSVHMEQALVALLTNAVQASEPGQAVGVAAEAVPDGARMWRLIVTDHGPGILPEIREKIFLPHFTTKQDGQGIGLAMASKVIRMHGGELTVESEPGQTTRFIATLPGLLEEE